MNIDDIMVPNINIIENPSISVIMCVYNTPKVKLEEAFNSVSCQQFKDYEFIIIDDCSDNKETTDFIDRFKTNWTVDLRQQKLSVYRNPKNFGLAYSRNYGVSKAKGEWIYFIDSDDYMWGLTLQKMWSAVQDWYSYISYDIDMVIGDCIRGNKRPALGYKPTDTIFYYDKYDAMKEICRYSELPNYNMMNKELQFNATWNKLIRKSILYDDKKEVFKVRFKEGYPHEDNFTTHKIFYNCSGILFLPIQTYFYRYGGAFADGKQYKDTLMIEAKKERQDFIDKWYNEVIQDNLKDEDEPPRLPPGFSRAHIWKDDNNMYYRNVKDKINYIKSNNYAWLMRTMYNTYCQMDDKSVFGDVLSKIYNGEIDLDVVKCKSLVKRIKKITEEDNDESSNNL